MFRPSCITPSLAQAKAAITSKSTRALLGLLLEKQCGESQVTSIVLTLEKGLFKTADSSSPHFPCPGTALLSLAVHKSWAGPFTWAVQMQAQTQRKRRERWGLGSHLDTLAFWETGSSQAALGLKLGWDFVPSFLKIKKKRKMKEKGDKKIQNPFFPLSTALHPECVQNP